MIRSASTQRRMLRRHQGVALLAVLWLVAALSVMLNGLLHVVRNEATIAGQSRKIIIDQGHADAAIRLVLRDLLQSNSKSIKFIQTRTVPVFGSNVIVELTPLNGLIDLNSASSSLLADVFEFGGGLRAEEAQRLANAAIQIRDRKSPEGVPERFHAAEDLLRIQGLDYYVYAKIKNLIVTDIISQGRVNPFAAPEGILLVLFKGNRARAQQLIESRSSNPEFMDITSLTASSIDRAPTSYLELSANTSTVGHVGIVRSWRVDISSPAHGLPWRVLSVEQRVNSDAGLAK